MSFLLVGLGNIGLEYENTRHNIGFSALDRLAESQKLSFVTDRLASKADFKFKGKHIHLIKPTTYMNLSGRAVAYWMQSLKTPVENILIICDDLNLPFGSVRIRGKGSSGGQNGLNNINEVLGTENYARMRLGIGNEFSKGQQSEYVLGKFSREQNASIEAYMAYVSEAMVCFCTDGLTNAMNKYNRNGI